MDNDEHPLRAAVARTGYFPKLPLDPSWFPENVEQYPSTRNPKQGWSEPNLFICNDSSNAPNLLYGAGFKVANRFTDYRFYIFDTAEVLWWYARNHYYLIPRTEGIKLWIDLNSVGNQTEA